jgi:hypothetical protein
MINHIEKKDIKINIEKYKMILQDLNKIYKQRKCLSLNIKEKEIIAPKRQYITSLQEIKNVYIFYREMERLSPGDQWTLISDKQMTELISEGYKIECFGSSYNTRMDYFGSISIYDEPWGRLGTYDFILKKLINSEPLYWRDKLVYGSNDDIKIIASPPSGKKIQNTFINLVFELFEKRNTKINYFFSLSMIHENLIKKCDASKYKVKKIIENNAWNLQTGEHKDLSHRQWVSYLFQKY